MCGIIGYSGDLNAVDVICDGLETLEYRGYDSAGIAVFRENIKENNIEVTKSQGKLLELRKKLSTKKNYTSSCGIGHTRWATHGAPSDINSHPHQTKNLALVHNGIIENYLELKNRLISLGVTEFVSETDTEVAARLIDYYFVKTSDPIKAIRAALNEIRGAYAFGIVFNSVPNTVYATRKDSPLICAKGERGNFIASDVPAVLKYTKKYFIPEEGEIAVIQNDTISFLDKNDNPIQKECKDADWDVESADIGDYPHFMYKEIMEQPSLIRKTAELHIKNGLPEPIIAGLSDEELKKFRRIFFVACGTAMHAGLVGKLAIEKLARIPVSVEIASEFRYNPPVLNPSDLIVFISQSGETADTLAALRLSKEIGCKTLGIVNTAGSSIAREANYLMLTSAGPEIAVASTKAYTGQLCVLYLLALKLGYLHGTISEKETRKLAKELQYVLPYFVGGVISDSQSIRQIAEIIKDSEDLFYIGRGLDYVLSMEGSLKLKEITYIHSEAYAAGELKHGTISLITDGTPVIALATNDSFYEKMISNIKEVKSRGAKIILICKYASADAEKVADTIISLPHCSEIFSPLVAVPALQLLAYYTAVLRGCDVDKPRNLAKSVTVE